MQLEIQRKESTTRLQELEQENKLFKDELENLRMMVHISEEEDPAVNDHYLHSGKCTRIMQEKDTKINHLYEQISRLQQQLDDVTDNKMAEEKNEQIRELEAQVECLRSDQDRVKKNNSDEIEQLNDVIEKLQQELANIEGKVPVDLSIISEDGDSLKHQLDAVLAENRNLQQIIDINNAEVTLTKRELKEASYQMKLLKDQLETWEMEQGTLKHKANSSEVNSSDVLITGDSIHKTEKLAEALRENVAKSLTYQSLLTSVEETMQDTVISMELRLKELQETVQCKDSELNKCYKQIQILEEQNESERAVLENKFLEMEEKMQENLAAVLVSQAQLKAVQVQTKFNQNVDSNSNEFANILNSSSVQSTLEEQAESQVSALTLQLLDINNQFTEMRKQLLFEREQVNISQREAVEKEHRLSDLRKIIESMQKNQNEQEVKMEESNPSEAPTGRTSIIEQNAPLSELQLELEKLRAEAAIVKEELNNYREKTEKLTEELAVKETSFTCLQEDLFHVKQSLTEAELKLEQYVKLGYQPDCHKNVESESVKTHLIKTTNSSQTDKAQSINSSNQTVLVNQRDAEIQKDLSHTEKVCSSEKVAEVINQYAEKIVQMQELHAAEILDMEARHISEAEALRREKFVVVQALTEECEDLRAMIENLSTKQVISVSGMQHSTSYQNSEGTSRDDASDWSPGTGVAEDFDPTSERMKVETGASTVLLPDKIKNLLRAVHHEGMQVLSLSEEFPDSEKDIQFLLQGSEEWFEERKGFLNAIASLKDLISKMQVYQGGELHGNSELSEKIPDWRGELLCAIQDVFLREQDVLVTAFRTQLAALGNKNAALLVNQLKDNLKEQGMVHISAMDCIRNADRRSLLLEIQALRDQKSCLQIDAKHKQQMAIDTQGLMAKDVLNIYTPMQDKPTDTSPRSTELQDQLHSERLSIAELKTQLAQTTLELESTLKAQNKHFKELEELRKVVTEKANVLDTLNDTLAHEQKRTRELQWALEKEKAKMERIEGRGKEELEILTVF